MDDKPNYYELLDVHPGASKDDIKRAYRKQALLFHPDKMKPHMKDEASQHFQLISQAYEVLYDDAKRELYDQYGEEGVKAGGPPPSQSTRDTFYGSAGPSRGYSAGGAPGPGFGFGFGGFDFPDFFGMPQHHRQFHDHAFASHHQRHRGAFDRHMESMFEQAGFGRGFPGGNQSMFAGGDPLYDENFHRMHHDLHRQNQQQQFNQQQQQSTGSSFSSSSRPTLFSTSPFANPPTTSNDWFGTGTSTNPLTNFGTGGGFTTSSSSSSSSFSGGPRGGARTSTKTTIVNGRRTTVTDVTDAEGNTTTTVENPDGTRQTFINGTPAPAIESGSRGGRASLPGRGATTSSGTQHQSSKSPRRGFSSQPSQSSTQHQPIYIPDDDDEEEMLRSQRSQRSHSNTPEPIVIDDTEDERESSQGTYRS
ncbi:hypothetical protein BGZ82_010508 [Podila clonocystis]|nr:hypothetical protein BGZ82_010508 [Podila clonocystis]